MQFPTPSNLIEWFASLTGKVPNTDKLAAEQEAKDAERRQAEKLNRPSRVA